MKKIIIIIKIEIYIILLALNIALLYLGTYTDFQYIFSKIVLFTLLVYTGFLFIDIFTKSLLKRDLTEKKQNIIIISRTVVFFLMIILIGSSQLIYIQKKDTLYQRRCEYYDIYNNIIYESLYVGVCPDLNVLVQNNNELVFEVKQEALGTKNFDTFTSRGITIAEVDDLVTVESLSNITIHYDDNHFISLFDIKLSEYITYYQNELKTQILFSYHRVVENTSSTSFESIIKEAEYVEYSNGFLETLSHYEFSPNDYLEYRLYESGIEGIDDSIGDSTIIREQIISENEISTETVIELWHSDSQTLVDAYYNADWDKAIFTETSIYNIDGYVSIGTRTSIDLISERQYTIEYKEQNGVFYLYRMGTIKTFDPNIDFESTYNHIWYENESDGYTYLSDGKNDIIEFHKTDYGIKVINKRIFKFDYFKNNDSQFLEVTFKYNFDDYKRLYNYYLELTDFQYYDPHYIFREYNPLYLLD